MSSAPDGRRLLAQLSSLPVETHPPGSLVLTAGASTGKLLVLREGAVEVVIDGERIAEVSEPGAVFGELALLLGRPHGADVRALRPTTFHVADGASYLRADPGAALYLATVLARRVAEVDATWSRPGAGAGRTSRPGVRRDDGQHRRGDALRPAPDRCNGRSRRGS